LLRLSVQLVLAEGGRDPDQTREEERKGRRERKGKRRGKKREE